MKYLFVTADKYPPFRVDVSELFGKEMIRHGHCIDFLMQSAEVCQKPYITYWSGCRVFVGAKGNGNSFLAKVKKSYQDGLNDLRIIRLIKNNDYEFVLVKDKCFAGLLLGFISLISKKNWYIYWLSFPIPEAYINRFRLPNARFPLINYLRGYIYKFLIYKIVIPLSSHVFVQSKQMKKDIQKWGIDVKKMTSVPMGISESLLELTSPLKEHAPQKCLKIVYLGTLLQTRRLDFIIRSFQKVLIDWPNAELYMVGDGDDRSDVDTLKLYARELGISKSIIFTGFLPRQEALSFVRDANVCVSPFFPSPLLNSTSPTKLIEYMAMKKAVVANDHPEQSQILNKSRGGFCVPWEEGAFAEAIGYLLGHPNEANEMGQRNYEYILQHRTYKIISEWLNKEMLEITNKLIK